MKRVTREFINSLPDGIWIKNPYDPQIIFIPIEVIKPILKEGKSALKSFLGTDKCSDIKKDLVTFGFIVPVHENMRVIGRDEVVSTSVVKIRMHFNILKDSFVTEVILEGWGQEFSAKFNIHRDLVKFEKELAIEGRPPIKEI